MRSQNGLRGGSPDDAGAERSRERVRDLVLAAGADGVTVAQAADAVGLHRNTARFHLDALVRAGEVEAATAEGGGRGRPARVFRASPPRRDDADAYRMLAEILVTGIAEGREPERTADAVGRRWASMAVSPADASDDPGLSSLLSLMDECGFSPDWDADEALLRLRTCPFAGMLPAHGGVVCGVHGGIIAGALEASGTGRRLEHLTPFASAGVCTAALSGGAR